MPFKKDILNKIFDEYPNATYATCKKEIINLTEPYYNKLKSLHKTGKGKVKGKGKSKKVRTQNTNSSISIDQTLISMNDVEQSRHLYKQVICRTDIDIRTRLEAAKALANLKEKQGQINMEEQSEKEVMDKFRQQTTQSLVSKLKESSQKEL